jgi:hypothetical protein
MLKKVMGAFCALMLITVFAGVGDTAEYITAKKCKACHMKQYKAYQL